MRFFILTLFTMVLAAPSPARAQNAPGAPQPSVQLPPELDRVLRDYETRYRIGGDTLAALFAEDGFVLSGGLPPVRGRAAIARHYGRAGGPLQLRAIAYETEGDVGFIIGGYRYPPHTTDIGKFTLTLRRDASGTWLIYSDMDNTNARPRQP
jgi:ketosteroid isomerase-like protein